MNEIFVKYQTAFFSLSFILTGGCLQLIIIILALSFVSLLKLTSLDVISKANWKGGSNLRLRVAQERFHSEPHSFQFSFYL